LVVEHVAQADKSAGGVFLPDTAKEKPQEGIVKAIGTGRTLDNGTKLPMDVKVGDRIIYSKLKSKAKNTSSFRKKTCWRCSPTRAFRREYTRTWLLKNSYSTKARAARSSAAPTSWRMPWP
jgi:co-chaperonin GroES (HSP10)